MIVSNGYCTCYGMWLHLWLWNVSSVHSPSDLKCWALFSAASAITFDPQRKRSACESQDHLFDARKFGFFKNSVNISSKFCCSLQLLVKQNSRRAPRALEQGRMKKAKTHLHAKKAHKRLRRNASLRPCLGERRTCWSVRTPTGHFLKKSVLQSLPTWVAEPLMGLSPRMHPSLMSCSRRKAIIYYF